MLSCSYLRHHLPTPDIGLPPCRDLGGLLSWQQRKRNPGLELRSCFVSGVCSLALAACASRVFCANSRLYLHFLTSVPCSSLLRVGLGRLHADCPPPDHLPSSHGFPRPATAARPRARCPVRVCRYCGTICALRVAVYGYPGCARDGAGCRKRREANGERGRATE